MNCIWKTERILAHYPLLYVYIVSSVRIQTQTAFENNFKDIKGTVKGKSGDRTGIYLVVSIFTGTVTTLGIETSSWCFFLVAQTYMT